MWNLRFTPSGPVPVLKLQFRICISPEKANLQQQHSIAGINEGISILTASCEHAILVCPHWQSQREALHEVINLSTRPTQLAVVQFLQTPPSHQAFKDSVAFAAALDAAGCGRVGAVVVCVGFTVQVAP